MSDFEFGGSLYPNSRQMLDAIAEAWITAGGANDRWFVATTLLTTSDDELATDCVQSWCLHRPKHNDDELPSHMAEHGYDVADLAAAFARFRQAQADHGDEAIP